MFNSVILSTHPTSQAGFHQQFGRIFLGDTCYFSANSMPLRSGCLKYYCL